jgi:Do/DeqQ family serine protease
MQNPFTDPRPRGYLVGAVVLVLVGALIGLGVSASLNASRSSIGGVDAVVAGTSASALSGGAGESPFVAVVDRALPAVVFIDVRKKVTASSSDDPQEELFRRFFGDNSRHPRVQPSSGSGFIIDTQGHVLTNNHVVRDADDITVTLNDRRTFKAKVVGADPETDVAVIKIDGDHLPVLPLGDSDQLRVGDWAIAIGNPLGQLRGSVTVGIISAQGRTDLTIWGGTPSYQDFIQTDASINFGNSGGPLCNIRGEAIGINTAINTSGQGIGFAIPINLVKHVADQLMASGKVQRAWIGIQLAELTPELAEGFGLSEQKGILVQDVLAGTPAEKAGLKRNDVIVEYDGQSVSDLPKFRLKVADTRIGARVPITVLRDGKRIPLTVTLTERPKDGQAQVVPSGEEPAEPAAVAGLRVRELTADERASAKVESGVIVTDVDEGSAADEAGIQPGDIIEQVGGKPVSSPATLTKMLKDAKASRKHAALLVYRDGRAQFVPLSLAE